MPHRTPPHLPRRVRAWVLVVVGAVALGGATAVGVAAAIAASFRPTVVTGRETIRFPDGVRSGVVVWRDERPGVTQVTVRSGMIVRSGGDFDATPGAAEALVPERWRDRLVPWGWDGEWAPGLWRVRHLVAVGWPWRCGSAVLEAQGDSPLGPGGWQVVEGTVHGAAAANAWDPAMPALWPTHVDTGGLVADAGSFAAAWFVLLATARGIVSRLVRASRRRRGVCPWCRYPLAAGGLAGPACPECGGATGRTPTSAGEGASKGPIRGA